MKNYLPFFQIGTAFLLILLILLQPRGASLGSAFGQAGIFFTTKRGIQKKIFMATIFLGFLFILFALLNLILK